MILSPDLTTILKTAESAAERSLAQLLHRIDGGPEAVAFHSVKLRSHRHKQQAEADFVIVWNGVVVVFEVKGGGIRHIDGKWWTRNRRDEWSQLKEPPMDQANGAKIALRTILKEDGLGWYPDQHAVVTPDTKDLGRAIGWYPTHWLTSADMTVAAMAEALDQIAKKAPHPGQGVRRARIADIRTKLYGEFSRLPVVDAQRGAVLEEQNRATEGQAKYLEGLARNPRILVLGGAGTGKSLALAQGAIQDAAQGRTVMITFRSPGLARLFEVLVEGRGIDVVPFAHLEDGRTYDTVFVDEAQDLMNAEDMDCLDGRIRGGLTQGRWRMFLDQNNQAHLDGTFETDVLQLIRDEAVQFELPLNVRNTRSIVHVVQSYLGADIGDPGIVHGEPIHWHYTGGAADLRAAEALARRLVTEGTPSGSIWIVDISSSAAPRTTEEGVTITSPRYAKGLEADRVIVCSLPTDFDRRGAAAFYVGTTRARVGLHILANNADKKRLQDLLTMNLGKP